MHAKQPHCLFELEYETCFAAARLLAYDGAKGQLKEIRIGRLSRRLFKVVSNIFQPPHAFNCIHIPLESFDAAMLIIDIDPCLLPTTYKARHK